MGLFFTLLYILVAFLTPPVVFGPLAEYHIEIILVIPTILFTLAAAGDAGIFNVTQTYGVLGMMLAAFLSIALGMGIRFGLQALNDFCIPGLVYFFVAINCRKKNHLKMLTVVLLVVALFDIVQFNLADRSGVDVSPYFYTSMSSLGETFHRLRGLGVIADPNDFGQYSLALIPCLFFFWKKGKSTSNLFLVYLPTAFIFLAIYQTHSRGALLALGVAGVVAGRKKFGVVPSSIFGGVMLVGLMAAGFTGGRDISADSGEDRMQLWDAGLQMIRSHPVFGVGYSHFMDYAPNTAHNSIVVCCAEVGLLGFFCWVVFVFSGLRDMYVLNVPETETPGEKEGKTAGRSVLRQLSRAEPSYAFAAPAFVSPGSVNRLQNASQPEPAPSHPIYGAPQAAPSSAHPYGPAFANPNRNPISEAEIRRMAGLVIVSFAGLLTTGWFLSRAFSMVLYTYVGITVVVFRLAKENGVTVPVMPLSKAMKYSLPICIVLVAIVYVILRIDHLRGH